MSTPPMDPIARLSHNSVNLAQLRQIAVAASITLGDNLDRATILTIFSLPENLPLVEQQLHLLPEISINPEMLRAEAKRIRAQAELIKAETEAAKFRFETAAAVQATGVAKLQILREALDTSTKVNRTLGLSFVALMFYILLIISSTTDLQLFLPESKVRLPIIDVELPMLGFYTVVPYLILIFHFHLLINLKHHQDKYRLWRAKADKEARDTGLDPILINFVDSYEGRFNLLRILLLMIISVSVFYFPLIDIVLMQLRFASYHSFLISTLQWSAAILDTSLIIIFFYKVFLRKPETKPSLLWRVFSFGNMFAFGISGVGIVVWLVALRLQLTLTDPIAMKSWSFLWTPRIDLTNTVGQLGDVADGYVLHYLRDSLSEDEASAKAFAKFGKPINLEGRDLRYAVLNGVNLVRANMNSCRLDSISMGGAHLEEATLDNANLEGANLRGAILNEASLISANLKGSKLRGGYIQRASLEKAHLEGADLREMYCEEVDLRYAHLEGAILRRSCFQGANLYRAHLEGADLELANFGGANLRAAQLEGAQLYQVNFEGAEMQHVCLYGAQLGLANLHGADLTNASLQGADLQSAELKGAILNSTFLACVLLDPTSLDSVTLILVDSVLSPDWDTIVSKSSLISDPTRSKLFLRGIKDAKSRCIAHEYTLNLKSGISEEERVKLLPCIACQNIHIMKGILAQFVGSKFDESRKVLLESLLIRCKDKVLEVQERWPYLLEAPPSFLMY